MPNPALGIGLKVASALAFTLMAALVRGLALPDAGRPAYPLGQMVAARSFFALLPIILWLWHEHQLGSALKTSSPMGHVRRGLAGSAAMFSGFAALAFLPLSDATAIGFAAPLFTVVLAALVLKETVRIYRWSAVAVGFVGVLVMLMPHLSGGALAQGLSGGTAVGAALGLLGALMASLAMIAVRRLTATESTGTIVIYFSLLTTLISLLTLFYGFLDPRHAWVLPGLRDGLVMVLIGTLGGIGQILLTASYRHADASLIAPFDYTGMIWAILVGWFFFSEWPDVMVLAGSAIVILSGLFVILREHRLGIERKRQMSAGPPRAL